jgi:glucose-1-phosphate thymidylyltransferase
MKGVILAGGTGSRLHPLTRITNKHLLPIHDRPMVNFAIEALVNAGIDELMLVTGGTHAGEFFRLLGNGHEHGIDRLFYAYQEEAGGIAEALGLAERFGAGDRICVMLADNVLEGSLRPAAENFAKQEHGARILLSPVEEVEHLQHLGVPELNGDGPRRPDRREAGRPAEQVRGHGHLLLRRVRLGRDPNPEALRPRRARDHRREQLVRRPGNMEYDVLDGFWGDAGESIDAYYEVNDFVRANGANKK